jgi:hypothetical protein
MPFLLSMIRRPVVWLVATAVAAVLLLFAHHAYPTPNTDAPSFLVGAVNFARGQGLVNPYYPHRAFGDLSGRDRLVYYPPAFPLTVGLLMPEPTSRGAFLAVAVLRALSIALAAVLLCRVASMAATTPSRGLTALVALSLCGLATNWLPTLGRPEALATLLVILAALAALWLRGWTLVAVFGVLLGLTAATQPMGAVELGLVMCLWLAAREPPEDAAPRVAVTAAIAVLVFTVFLAVSPHGLRETLSGILRSYPHTPWSSLPGSDWWKPWLTARRSTFYLPLFAAAAGGAVWLVVRRPAHARSPYLLAAAAAGLLASLYHGSFTHHALRNYNALLLSPIAFALLVAVAARRPAARAIRAGALVCVAASTVGFFGHLAFLPWFLRHGHTLEEGRARWTQAPIRPEARVSVSGNLWALSEQYDRLQMTPSTAVGDPRRLQPVLLLGQRREYEGEPPQLAGFRLVLDWFNRELARPGLHRYFVAEDYSFAVYVKQSP